MRDRCWLRTTYTRNRIPSTHPRKLSKFTTLSPSRRRHGLDHKTNYFQFLFVSKQALRPSKNWISSSIADLPSLRALWHLCSQLLPLKYHEVVHTACGLHTTMYLRLHCIVRYGILIAYKYTHPNFEEKGVENSPVSYSSYSKQKGRCSKRLSVWPHQRRKSWLASVKRFVIIKV